ncbi:hypothetical protein V8F06_013725 [Rhypophila decipiens]
MRVPPYRGGNHYTGTTGRSTSGGLLVSVPYEVQSAGAVPASSLTREIEPYLGRNAGPYPLLRPDGTPVNATLKLPPIPIEWIISPGPQTITSADQCPTPDGTIGAFVAADLILALILLLVGNIGASLVVVNTPGYQHLEFATIFALYASRPRLKVWWLAILRTTVTVNGHRFPDGNKRLVREKAERIRVRNEQQQDVSPESEPKKQEHPSPHDCRDVQYEEVEHPYLDSYISAVMVEILFQTVAAIFIGVTWKRFPNTIIRNFMQPSLNYMFVAPALTLLAAVVGVPIWRVSGEAWGSREKEDVDPQTRKLIRRWSPKGMKMVRFKYAAAGSLFFIPAYVASWVYWTHFFTLPGALWCPPDLPSQAAIWIFTMLVLVVLHCLPWWRVERRIVPIVDAGGFVSERLSFLVLLAVFPEMKMT